MIIHFIHYSRYTYYFKVTTPIIFAACEGSVSQVFVCPQGGGSTSGGRGGVCIQGRGLHCGGLHPSREGSLHPVGSATGGGLHPRGGSSASGGMGSASGGGLQPWGGGLHPGGEGLHPGGLGRHLPVGNYGIRSTSGRYASYWNAFLFPICFQRF